jgi:hypothetical protein
MRQMELEKACNYHGKIPSDKELDILSNPDAVYLSEGKSGRLTFQKGNDVVIVESQGSKKGQIVTSYGDSAPTRGDSGAAIFGGSPTDPGLPVSASDIINGNIPTPGGGTLPPATQIYP